MYEKRILDLIKLEAPQNPIAYVNNIIKDYAAENLKQVMLACKDSGQDDFRTVFNGSVHSDIMIINDKPRSRNELSLEGTDELALIKKAFSAMGYDPEQLFIIDAVNFNTYKEVQGDIVHRTPTLDEVESCKVFVDHAIDIVRPKAVLLLGAIASNLYVKEPFNKIRGTFVSAKGVPAIATHHPNKLLNLDGMFDEHTLADLKEEFLDDVESIIKSVN